MGTIGTLARTKTRMKLGLHSLIYSSQPDELRAFLRDKLGMPCYDTGGGWLMFPNADADLGVHPAEGIAGGSHEISFNCEDLKVARAELAERGVEFASEIEDHGWGYVMRIKLPGADTIMIYQPKYDRP